MIQAVLFDGDQTLWDFERVMRDALIAVAGELRAARPGAFADTLPALDALRSRYRLGLLSNGSRLPETVGPAGYFEAVV